MSDSPLIVVAADLNNNLIDGSVIWLRNVLRALSGNGERARYVALLRETRLPASRLFPPNLTFQNTVILDPLAVSDMDTKRHDAIRSDQLTHILTLIEDRYGRIGGILVRGSSYVTSLMGSEAFRSRTSVYTTERPLFASTRSTPLQRDIVRHAHHLFVQSDALKRYYEVYMQAAPGTVTVLPPMVDASAVATQESVKQPLVSYAGKLDRLYCVEELVDMAPDLASAGIKIQIVGNKFNRAPDDPQFQDRLREKLNSVNVDWVDGASHEDSQRYMQSALFGFCVRSVELDNTVELSTKLLEYCAHGTPPILRRTRQHVELFGDDYPYFVDTPKEVVHLVRTNGRSDAVYAATVERLATLARRFDIAEATARLQPVFPSSITAEPKARVVRRVPRLLVATHDSKFLAAALDRISARGAAEVTFDRWASTHSRGQEDPVDLIPQADVVWCEWCCAQAVWWSRNKLPGQTLIVRLHRFEAFTPFPRQVDWSSVDHLIVVSDHFRRLAIEELGVPEQVIHVLPQYVDTAEFDRPKLRSADYTIGLVGVNAFSHKRPDRAIEYINALAKADPRFRLRVRSRMPWEFSWVWEGRPEERTEFIRLFQRCLQPSLRERVLFDRAGNDMPEWFRCVTAILSSSDSEGCHTSIAEGMSSGCLPVCWAWPGAASLYGSRFVHESIDGMVGATLAAVEEMHSPAGRAAFKAEGAKFDIRHTLSLIEELLP
jgi:hypothetical protein